MKRRSFLRALGLGAAAGVAAKIAPNSMPKVDTSSVQTAKAIDQNTCYPYITKKNTVDVKYVGYDFIYTARCGD